MSHDSLSMRRWMSVVGLVALAAALAVMTSSPAQAAARPRPVRVMTRNLYLGADLSPAIASQSPLELALAATAIWRQVLDTNFPERAKALAAEIGDADPVLIALQEVALWRSGVPDGPPAFGGTPAEEVEVDFLQVLQGELQARGLKYNVSAIQQEGDIEAPTILGFDVRLTQRDVILAKAGLPSGELRTSNAQSANFSNNLSFTIAGGLASVTSTRGWTSVDVVANRRSFRLVNTHLEAFSNFYRTVQTLELLSGPLATGMKVIVAGDLNSDPSDPVFGEPGSPFNATNPYDVLAANGFTDTWVQANQLDPGFTCCNAADLLNATPTLTERVDHILTRPSAAAYRSTVVGIDADNRTPGGLWPGDHAGVVAALAP